MLGAFWRKVSAKTISAPRSFKKARALSEEAENFFKGESRSSRSKICEMNILLGLSTFLSNEKLQIIRVLNQPLKIPRRLLHIAPNLTNLHRDFNIEKSDFVTHGWLLLQRNIDREIITQVKRWNSTQSSCEKDCSSKKSRRCIEDHQQSAEFCAKKTREKCESNDCPQISAESCQKSCNDLLNHQEYYQSVESSSPIYSNKPVPYIDWQACHSMKRDFRKSTRITCESWTCGKPATERKIYHKCKPQSCVYSNIRDETIHFPSDVSKDCNEKKSEEMTVDKSKRIETTRSVQQCSETKPSFSEKNCTLSEKKTISENKMSTSCPVSDTNERTKLDSPPPRCQHWSENPPSYSNHCSNKTVRTPVVKSSPIIFVPRKKPWKFWMKGTTSSFRDIQKDREKYNATKNECDKTDTEAKITPRLSKNVSAEKYIPRRVISFENKCAASLTFPAFVDRTKQRVVQRFPKLTRSGRGCIEKAEKDLVTTDVSDCNPSMASFKYRLSKCPSIKKMWSINHKSSDTDTRPKQEATLFVCEKRGQESRPQNKVEIKRKRFKSSGGWIRQRYKIRLKIFQKGNGCLDPCLPQIVELRRSRDGKMNGSILSKLFNLTTDETSPRLKIPCRPLDYCSSKRPVVENKNYPTKMNESRMICDQNLRLCKKRR